MASGTVPILFIHGAFTRASRWQPWVGYFSSLGYSCHAVSLPAHDPPDPARLAGLTFTDYVAAMCAEVARFGTPPILVGHSMGGLIAQHVAAATTCAALVLVSSAPPWRPGATRWSLPYTFTYFLGVAAGRPIRANRKAALELVLHDLPPEDQAALVPDFAYESGKAYRTMVLGRAPMAPGAVRCPVLCVSGGDDRVLRPKDGRSLAAFYGADHLVFPGQGHSLVARSTVDTIAGAVGRWIADRAALAPLEPSFRAAAVV